MIRRCTLVCVGKPKGWAAEGSEDYAKRLRRYFSVEILEVDEEDINRRSREEVLSSEGGRILARLPTGAYVISLEREKGKQNPS
jgi:23S rRNA pseudoU1915 N3-methylase RlmH